MEIEIPIKITKKIRVKKVQNEQLYDIKLSHYSNSQFHFSLLKNGIVERSCSGHPRDDLMHFLLLDLLSGNKLFELNCSLSESNYGWYRHRESEIILNFEIKEDLIPENLDKNPILKYWVDLYYYKNNFSSSKLDINNISLLPNEEPFQTPNNCKIELFDYQKKSLAKMIAIENKSGNKSSVPISVNLRLGNNIFEYNPISGIFKIGDKLISITTNGGILADEMGLGKTLTTLSLIKYNTIKSENYKNFTFLENQDNRIKTEASLIICPNHLAKQWIEEAKKAYPKLKLLKLLTKTNHNKLTYQNILEADAIVVTQQFLMNFKHYPRYEYSYCTPATINLNDRFVALKTKLEGWKGNLETLTKRTNPILELFHFKRVIIDEGHEIFGEMVNSNQSLSSYISELMGYFSSQNFWFVSGTPFSNKRGLMNTLSYIKMEININDSILKFTENKRIFTDYPYLNNEGMMLSILANSLIRHRKKDVTAQIDIPGYDETVIWVNHTEIEKGLYQSRVNKSNRTILQQLCCHPLVAESFTRIIGNTKEVDLDSMKDKLLEYHENIVTTYKYKLETLVNNNPSYHMLKATYTSKVSESNYMLTILKKMINKDIPEDENCSICFDELDDPTLTSCGHLFCNDCLKMCLKVKQECPMCKTNLKGKEILSINKKEETVKKSKSNPLIDKYGAKLGKIISVIRHIVSDENNRVIVFSQWDSMLNLISNSLAENGVGNSFVKGNVYTRNSAISKFKNGINKMGGENKVIMLSLNNSASGTNLTEATHIFFVEPIDSSKKECEAIEGQAIGRACRLGQNKKVKIIRVLTKNTIEEEIFNKNYNEKKFVKVNSLINIPVEIDV